MSSLQCLFLLGLVASGSLVPSARGPCDIYASGGTPCVAAHSTTRALFGAYDGPLYDVIRGSDNETIAITPISAGGVANSAAQDEFCKQTTCLISMIYDQSGHGNNLRQAPSGGAAVGPDDGYDFAASAIGAPVTLNGQKAYGVFIQPGSGYRIDDTNDIAVGNEPEGIYEVLDGTHYNGGCCFDYGNAEHDNDDNGAGHMEALYFGLGTGFNTGAGSGPWILMDMENGLYSEDQLGTAVNPNDPTINYRFTHAIVKGKQENHWAIRGGNAQSGTLGTFWSGPRPSGYYPMHKEGSIILGTGGDNSDWAQGTFYEGAMTKGYPADNIEDMVQANILAAKYETTSLTTGPPLTTGSIVTVRANYPSGSNNYLTNQNESVSVEAIKLNSKIEKKRNAQFTVVTGHATSSCFSFESVEQPGYFLRHSNYELYCDPDDGTMLFDDDSTFCPQAGLDGHGTSFRSWSYPTRYWRRYNGSVYIGQNGGPYPFDTPTDYNDQVSWDVGGGFRV